MSWLKLDNRMYLDARVIGLSHKAFRVHIGSLMYCSRYGSNKITKDALYGLTLKNLRRPSSHIAELVEAGLWVQEDADTYRLLDLSIGTPKPPRTKLRRTRQKLIARDGGTCQNCGIKGKDMAAGEVLTVDHIVPVARGGTEELSNKQLLCGPCNRTKGITHD